MCLLNDQNNGKTLLVDQNIMAKTLAVLLISIICGAEGSHIVGGRDAVPHSRPYMASLQLQGRHGCGGLLVQEGYVLTAAHCQIPVPFTVVLGGDSLTANESTKQTFTSVRSIPHPDYDGHANDIMLLKLNGTANITAEVQLIPLPRTRLRAGRNCITAGWGDIGDNNTLANRLQEVNVTILSQRRCRERWGAVPITRTMVCGTGADNFQGFCSVGHAQHYKTAFFFFNSCHC